MNDINTKETMKITQLMPWLAVAIVLLSGCQSNKKATTEASKPPPKSGFFQTQADRDTVTRFADIQAANGARHDGMLFAAHFDGAHLNSLGRQKVMLMLDNCDNCEPITVHMVNCGEGELLAQRKASVELYLKTVDGINVEVLHAAAPDLLRYQKTESNDPDSTAGTTAAAGAGSSAGVSGAGSDAK